ncbi:MAG: energy transducer TonB [Bacteroidota bacterium]
MNILGNNTSKLNEVIFANRNKSYGAYAIRQSYNDSLLKSLLCLSSMIVLLFGSVYAYNNTNKKTEIENMALFNDPILDPREYVTPVDMSPIKEPVQNATAPAVAPAGTIGTEVTDDEPENTTPVNLDNPINGTGSATATGVSTVGTETSTLTTISVVATTTTEANTVFVIVEEMPEFEGGTAGLMRYISQNIVYPSIPREAGIEGTVHVSFVVNEQGNVEGVKVMRGIGYGCDEEVIRVVGKMPRWKKAGKNSGHPVKVRYNIPVSFKLK